MSKETEFAVFCLENYKNHRHLKGKEVFDIFEKYGVWEYLREFFDVLHTTGEGFINQDIDDFLSVRGANV